MIKTRFAPSPTGSLHLGSARTALYCYLFARANNGKFILRIEDTDRERSTKESVDAILDGMEWMNLEWDEGPFYQTERLERYNEVLEKFLKEGKAYKCYCSKERLEELREKQKENKEKPRYDRHCLNNEIKDKGDYVIRFKNPDDGAVVFKDLVKGEISINNQELDDLIISRGDNLPTYNFVVVIDDFDMGITHVIRGDDHINNTPRQINLLKAMGADIPHYAHLSTILGDDGKRLSKRHGAVSVQHFREEGILPEALLNYLLRLGWSHKDKEIFSMNEMINLFDMEHINNSAAAFDSEKLLWLNQHYIKHSDENYLCEILEEQFDLLGINFSHGPKIEDVVSLQKDRVKTMKEMAKSSTYFYQPVRYDKDSWDKFITKDITTALEKCVSCLKETEWTKDNIAKIVKSVVNEFNLKFPQLAQPIRIATTGSTNSPSIDSTLLVLGKNTSIERLEKLLEKI